MTLSLPNQNQFKDLNEKQIEAVTLQNESALILAGAGSGKTKVLTSRIAWLIQTNVVSPFGLIAVTFTNKAAKEMLQRTNGARTIPQIFIGDHYVGGNDQLQAANRSGELDKLLS